MSLVDPPAPGETTWVRYDPSDPSKVYIDSAKLSADNAAAREQMATAAAEQGANEVPPEIKANGIRGRAVPKSVQKEPWGTLVKCTVTAGVRLVDGSPLYEATLSMPLAPETAATFQPGMGMFAVIADPNDHSKIYPAAGEPVPVVPFNDDTACAPAEQALSAGMPCRATIIEAASQNLRYPNGDEVWAIKANVDGSEMQTAMRLSGGQGALLQVGKELPAKRLIAPPVFAIDFAAATGEAGVAAA